MNKYDAGWTDFIISKLTEEEYPNKNPTCQGLLRVCEEVYGRILAIRTDTQKAPTKDDPTATVLAEIQCVEYPLDEEGNFKRDRVSLEAEGVSIIATGMADTSREYLPAPFDQHLISSIETRAISRAVKRILNLQCLTAEENVTNNDARRDNIKPTQVKTVKNMCKAAGVDLAKFLAEVNQISEEQLPNASEEQGKKLISTLNDYKNKKKEIPAEIIAK